MLRTVDLNQNGKIEWVEFASMVANSWMQQEGDALYAAEGEMAVAFGESIRTSIAYVTLYHHPIAYVTLPSPYSIYHPIASHMADASKDAPTDARKDASQPSRCACGAASSCSHRHAEGPRG